MKGLVLYTGEGSLAMRLGKSEDVEVQCLSPIVNLYFPNSKFYKYLCPIGSYIPKTLDTYLLDKQVLKENIIKQLAFILHQIERKYTYNPYIILAGFHYILPYTEYLSNIKKAIYEKRIINFHPSYQNKYKGMGMNCILEAIKNDDILGTTLHYVDAGVDTGEIIETQEVQIDEEIRNKIKSADKLRAIELIKTHIKPKLQDAEVLMFEKFWSKKIS